MSIKFDIKNKNTLYANPLQRMAAYLIDFIIIQIIFSVICLSLPSKIIDLNDIYKDEVSVETNDNKNIAELISFKKEIAPEKALKILQYYLLFDFLYFAFFLTSKKQQSIGNKILKIMVVNNKNVKMNILDVLIRQLSFIVNFQLYFAGALTYFFRQDGALLQDIMSKTSVVRLNKIDN